MRLINPILGAVLSWIMLAGEYPTFSTVAGMLIIVVGSLVIYFKGQGGKILPYAEAVKEKEE